MSLPSRGLRFARRLSRQVEVPVVVLPTFLCPAVLRIGPLHPTGYSYEQSVSRTSQRRLLHLSTSNAKDTSPFSAPISVERLPTQCPGCGALAQTVFEQEPGFYSLKRRSVKDFVECPSNKISAEDAVIKAALRNSENIEIVKEFETENADLSKRGESSKHHLTDLI
jgi:hypothetical protein